MKCVDLDANDKVIHAMNNEAMEDAIMMSVSDDLLHER